MIGPKVTSGSLVSVFSDSLLDADSEVDPFAWVFTILGPVSAFSHALVLAELDQAGSPLRCIVATDPSLVGGDWEAAPLLEKVMRGREGAGLADTLRRPVAGS